MTNEQRLIDGALRAWKFNEERIDKFFGPLSEEQLQQEIMAGRNRLIYLWGHIAAVNDALFPLLGLGPKRYPDLDTMFLKNPDRTVSEIYSGRRVAAAADEINRGLWTAFTQWTPDEWLQKHTTVSSARSTTLSTMRACSQPSPSRTTPTTSFMISFRPI